ncbi:uncharacterized protein [Leptinotarsa decemlineata]|uniref:uncharacterized protein n=1 Tax=Leptinotarsa decemlineata TaxID=7539 RepID=UPI000C253FBE|nr:uncharacterized protein LOC111506519 [Leptinotarsa decemlineata]
MSFLKQNKGCVLNCEEFIATDKGFVEVDFYEFPTDPELRNIWIERVRKQKKSKTWYPTKKSKLCGMHFNNSGKNIHNEVLPRYFGEKIYTPAIVIEPVINNTDTQETETIKIKEEIDVDEEPWNEDGENCIVDYSNIYNTVPVITSVSSGETAHSNFEETTIKEERLDFESEDQQFSDSMFENRVQQVTEKTVAVNGYTHQKDPFSLQKEDKGMNDPYYNPSCQWKNNFSAPPHMNKKENTTQTGSCSRDLQQLKNQMKELEESLSVAYRRISEGQILVMNLSSKERESERVKQQLEEENSKLKSALEAAKQQVTRNEPCGTPCLNTGGEIARLEMQLANMHEKVNSLQQQWYHKFDSFSSDDEVKFYTGFKNKVDFKKFCDMVIEMDPSLELLTCDTIKIRKEIKITLIWLRLGLQMQDLAFRYDLQCDEVRRCVMHWQNILSDSSFNRKICPSGVIIVKFFVVDLCNEFKLKYFLGVSPYGYVIYVSDLHPHLTDEREIIQKSEIQLLIQEGFTVKSLDTDRFSDLGIFQWSVSPNEEKEFSAHSWKLLKEVKKNGIFKNILSKASFYTNDVSKIWKICYYLQNYVES